MFSLQCKKQSNCKNQESSSRKCTEDKLNSQIDNQLPLNFGDADQYNLTENWVHRAIRRVEQLNPFIALNDLLGHPDIAPLFGVLDVEDIKDAYKTQPKVFNEFVAIEYLHRAHWNFNEAAFLTAGYDPMYATINPAFVEKARERIANIELKIRRAIKSHALNASIIGGVLVIEVVAYCSWALETGIENDDMSNYFRKILGAQTLLTSGGRADATSSPLS